MAETEKVAWENPGHEINRLRAINAELLEALKRIREHTYGTGAKVLRIAEAAIAKAEGRQ